MMQQLSAPSIDFQEMMKGIKRFKDKTEEEIRQEIQEKLYEQKIEQQHATPINLFNKQYSRMSEKCKRSDG